MNRNLSFSQRIHNMEATQEVQNTLGKHMWYHGRGASREDFGTNWSKRPDISWGQDWGRVHTRESFWYAKVTGYDMMGYRAYLGYYLVYPQLGCVDARYLFGAAIHGANTDIIEVADDGQSARGSWLAPANIHAQPQADRHPLRLTDLERYGSDFVYEDGKWLFLHNQVCPDVMIPGDFINWAAENYKYSLEHDGEGRDEEHRFDGVPYPVDDPGPIHNDYTVCQMPQNTVPWPVPYATMDKDNSYWWPESEDDLDNSKNCMEAWYQKALSKFQ